MDNITSLLSARQVVILRIILPQQCLMQCTYEVLRQRHLLHASLLRHHLQPHVTSRHLLHVTHISLPDNLTKQQ